MDADEEILKMRLSVAERDDISPFSGLEVS